ncbi:MAG TPA: hypothetical protein VEF76_12840 [Patescibacteria group bacterium]|nr:hypothetical protein [Patescibacteria group bacterium]
MRRSSSPGKFIGVAFAALLCYAAPALLAPLTADAATKKPAASRKAAGKKSAAVPVRIGTHDGFTRVVFDFNALTAYKVEGGENSFAVIFPAPRYFSIPKDTEDLITRVATTREKDGGTRVTFALVAGAHVKPYRMENKIVLDVTPATPGAKPPPDKAAAAKKGKTAEPAQISAKADESKPISLVPEKAPETAPAGKTETAAAPPEQPAGPPVVNLPSLAEQEIDDAVAAVTEAIDKKMPGKPNQPGSPLIVDAAPPEAAPPVAASSIQKPDAPVEPTVITLSTMEATRLAVFTRFNSLWVVLDTETPGAMSPSIVGPDAGLLGPSRAIGIPGGTAWRYALPEKKFISAERQNLTWRITLSPQLRQMPAVGRLSAVVDESTGQAKLMAELKGAGKVLTLPDPTVGDRLFVVATDDQAQRIDQSRRFADLEILPAAAGLALRPLNGDLKLTRIDNFVLISAPGGVAATPGANAGPSAVAIDATDSGPRDESRLFDFPNWRQGGILQLDRNVRSLQRAIIAAEKPEDRNALMMKLALLYFANNFGHETLGVLRVIEGDAPDMAKNPNFIALRGAASAMAGHYDEALADLSNPAIQQHGEVNLWKGYAAAATEQWRMASRSFPADNFLLLQYPENIAVPFTIYMAESALRLGKADRAKTLLATLDTMQGDFDPHYAAAIQYLKGEAARQSGNPGEAIRLWRPVALGLDRLYHTKASLALATLRYQEKQIAAKQAIEELDSLRFAWRGDGLEVQVLQSLGRMKIEDKKYLSGLEDMKTAAQLSDNMHEDSQPIRDEIGRVVADLFIGGGAKNLPPLEAVAAYNAYSTYLPGGEEGAIAALGFADSLIGIDLLDRAEALLELQLKNGALPAARLAATVNKLAAVYLLDKEPQKALATLTSAAAAGPEIMEERRLLRARALSQMNKPDDAIAVLSGDASADAQKLKADVLWRARKWKEAAATMQAMLPPPEAPLTAADAELVINTAVGYKLAGDNAGLAAIKAKYLAAMDATARKDTFRVVTREGGSGRLSDRETILKIAGEVDMFKGFLDSYKSDKGS